MFWLRHLVEKVSSREDECDVTKNVLGRMEGWSRKRERALGPCVRRLNLRWRSPFRFWRNVRFVFTSQWEACIAFSSLARANQFIFQISNLDKFCIIRINKINVCDVKDSLQTYWFRFPFKFSFVFQIFNFIRECWTPKFLIVGRSLDFLFVSERFKFLTFRALI